MADSEVWGLLDQESGDYVGLTLFPPLSKILSD